MNHNRNLLNNGRFLHNIDGWSATGATVYSAGDGDEHYGVAVLPAGDTLSQAFAVLHTRIHSLHLATKGGSVVVTITDGQGNSVLQSTINAATTWTETTLNIGLAVGGSYNLRLASSGAEAKVDDVWLWPVPLTRAQLATRVHAKLGRLASERSLNTATAGALTEGDYTYAVDAALRSVGAVDPETDSPDVRWLDSSLLDPALDALEMEMLEKLQRDYAVDVDLQIGPRRESLSQIQRAISYLTGTGENQNSGGSKGRVIMRSLRHQK